ncbi:PLP-dependent aminotransferase family protein [Acidobacteria bacterium AH-259-A15]|nr:PLP-dependent aminotransferase family protein [Acidobacteria bacterium AH-259-A15]
MITGDAEREYLYEQIAGKITQLIHHGTLGPGEKVPSVRKLSQQEGVSITTVLQAYYGLESRGLIEARPQSGFYVCLEPRTLPPEPEISSPPLAATHVGVDDLITKVFEAARDPDIIPLGAALPSPELFPNHRITRLLSSVARRDPSACNTYDLAPGNQELRRQIARRSLYWGGALSAEDIVVTCGCTEALNLCLRAVTEPGDIVAVESPTYFVGLQIIETLGLKALEIPTHPRDGISVEALEVAMEQVSIKACLVMANCHNPLGSCMPDENKKKLVALLARQRIPLIEDDIFGDLYPGSIRLKALKAFDKKGWVLYCSSFSKTLAPGYRVGWTVPGNFIREATRLKRANTVGTPTVLQIMIAEFLESGGYDHHLRKIKKAYASQVHRMTQAICRYFPKGTRVTRPKGGCVLWIELPRTVDSLELHRQAIEEKISIAPGPIFSAKQQYRNFIRLNCGVLWSPRIEQALMILGRLTAELGNVK